MRSVHLRCNDASLVNPKLLEERLLTFPCNPIERGIFIVFFWNIPFGKQNQWDSVNISMYAWCCFQSVRVVYRRATHTHPLSWSTKTTTIYIENHVIRSCQTYHIQSHTMSNSSRKTPRFLCNFPLITLDSSCTTRNSLITVIRCHHGRCVSSVIRQIH